MAKHNITKRFDFCYGHRVHNQKLDGRFATDTCLVCRHLHGHQGEIIIQLSADELTDGMVTDFKHLGWFKKWVDNYLDHKMILDYKDPLLPEIFPQLFKGIGISNIGAIVFEEISDNIAVRIVSPEMYEDISKPLSEVYEGLIFVNFVPTSENLSKWLFEVVQEKMKPLGVTVSSVLFKETPKTSAEYGL